MTTYTEGFDGPDTSPTSELLTALKELEGLPDIFKGPLDQIRINYLRETLRLRGVEARLLGKPQVAR